MFSQIYIDKGKYKIDKKMTFKEQADFPKIKYLALFDETILKNWIKESWHTTFSVYNYFM